MRLRHYFALFQHDLYRDHTYRQALGYCTMVVANRLMQDFKEPAGSLTAAGMFGGVNTMISGLKMSHMRTWLVASALNAPIAYGFFNAEDTMFTYAAGLAGALQPLLVHRPASNTHHDDDTPRDSPVIPFPHRTKAVSRRAA